MPGNAPSYLRPGAVDRIFGHTFGFLVRIGVIRGHFYVLEARKASAHPSELTSSPG
jgi:uncharacterized membrane protein required for colicin V production